VNENLTLFRSFVRSLCHGLRSERASGRSRVLSLLHEAGESQRYIGELLDLCVHEGGPDGLDIAIDVLCQTGDLVWDYASRFLRRDWRDWNQDAKASRSSDDIWYILFRAIARSSLDVQNAKLPLLILGLTLGSPSIREATVHALGDLGGGAAKKLLKLAAQDRDSLVRGSASEVLADLES